MVKIFEKYGCLCLCIFINVEVIYVNVIKYFDEDFIGSSVIVNDIFWFYFSGYGIEWFIVEVFYKFKDVNYEVFFLFEFSGKD